MRLSTRQSGIILLSYMLLSGILAIYLGKELCWDLANYHYYNAFAFLNPRDQIDFWPVTFIHRHLNPMLDLFSYYLINHSSPRMVVFTLGALHGINFWLLYLIARRFTPSCLIAIILSFLGLLAPLTASLIGSLQNDTTVSLFILSFIYLQICALQKYENHLSIATLFFSSLLLGLGTGFKYTAGIFVIGFLAALVTLPIKPTHRVKWCVISCLAIAIGMAISAGYWMVIMWIQHGNPLYPFFNNIFHSPDLPSVAWRDTRFLPKSFWEAVFFPFYFSWDGRVSDFIFRDFRFLILYILFALLAIKSLFMRTRLTLDTRWIFTFFIFTYFIWECFFSIERYLLPFEMLAPLIIFLLINNLFQNFYVRGVLFYYCIYLLTFGISYCALIRVPWYDNSYFNVKLPNVVSDKTSRLVLMPFPAYALYLEPRPQNYLIPYFPKTWSFAGISFVKEKYSLDEQTKTNLTALIAKQSGPIYLLASSYNLSELYRAAAVFGTYQKGKCAPITSDRQAISHQEVFLCEINYDKRAGT